MRAHKNKQQALFLASHRQYGDGNRVHAGRATLLEVVTHEESRLPGLSLDMT